MITMTQDDTEVNRILQLIALLALLLWFVLAALFPGPCPIGSGAMPDPPCPMELPHAR